MAAKKKKTPLKAARKPPSPKTAAKKPAKNLKKPAKKAPSKPAKKAPAKAKKAPVSKKPSKTPAKRPAAKAKKGSPKPGIVGTRDMLAYGQPMSKERRLNPWLKRQQLRLLALKDTLLDSMTGVARDNLRSGDAHEVSAHGLHQADAGSDAYDRDFALNLLSQEQDALFEIDEALKRIARGTYGICEMSGKPIPKARLEARPFARLTVECQNEIERKNRFSRIRQPVTRLFEPADDESEEESDEENAPEAKE